MSQKHEACPHLCCHLCLGDRVCRDADNKIFSYKLACLINGKGIASEMNSVGAAGECYIYAVVYKNCRVCSTNGADYGGDQFAELVRLKIFISYLYQIDPGAGCSGAEFDEWCELVGCFLTRSDCLSVGYQAQQWSSSVGQSHRLLSRPL